MALQRHAQRRAAGWGRLPDPVQHLPGPAGHLRRRVAAAVYNRGDRRRRNRAYEVVDDQIAKAKRHGDRQAVRQLTQRRRMLPSQDPGDPDYRRLRYVRYAHDWLLGFAGPRHEAEQIKSKIAAFLREELRLELSQSKTLITHATSQAARFLGYEIKAQHADAKITRGRRAVNGVIGLFVPRDVIRQRCALYLRDGKPAQRGALLHDDDYTIVAKYQAEYRGLVQYYLLAQDVFRLDTLHWVMETSMLKTLAGKHKSTVTKMARKYKTVINTPNGHGPASKPPCNQIEDPPHWSPASAASRSNANAPQCSTDLSPTMATTKRNELLHRLLAGHCELCDTREGLEVHHLRKLADLNRPGRPDRPAWVHLMAKRRRKTLVVCRACHEDIHTGRASAFTRN